MNPEEYQEFIDGIEDCVERHDIQDYVNREHYYQYNPDPWSGSDYVW